MRSRLFVLLILISLPLFSWGCRQISGADVESATEPDTAGETATGETEADADTDVDDEGDTVADDSDADSDLDADTDGDSATDVDADTDADSNTDPDNDTDTNSDTGMDSDTDTDSDSDREAGTETETAGRDDSDDDSDAWVDDCIPDAGTLDRNYPGPCTQTWYLSESCTPDRRVVTTYDAKGRITLTESDLDGDGVMDETVANTRVPAVGPKARMIAG